MTYPEDRSLVWVEEEKRLFTPEEIASIGAVGRWRGVEVVHSTMVPRGYAFFGLDRNCVLMDLRTNAERDADAVAEFGRQIQAIVDAAHRRFDALELDVERTVLGENLITLIRLEYRLGERLL